MIWTSYIPERPYRPLGASMKFLTLADEAQKRNFSSSGEGDVSGLVARQGKCSVGDCKNKRPVGNEKAVENLLPYRHRHERGARAQFQDSTSERARRDRARTSPGHRTYRRWTSRPRSSALLFNANPTTVFDDRGPFVTEFTERTVSK